MVNYDYRFLTGDSNTEVECHRSCEVLLRVG